MIRALSLAALPIIVVPYGKLGFENILTRVHPPPTLLSQPPAPQLYAMMDRKLALGSRQPKLYLGLSHGSEVTVVRS